MAFNKTKALAQADKQIAKQNFNKALNELLKVEKHSPSDINVLNKIGDLYAKLDKRKEALEYFKKVADSYLRSGFSLKAIALYKKMLRLDNRYMEARDRLVTLYMQQGHTSEARGELRQIAEIYLQDNLFPRALATYEKLIKIDPGNLDARLKMTDLLLREGKRKEAAKHLVAMTEELIEKKMIGEAEKVVKRGLQVDPENRELETLTAKCLMAQGKTDEAVARLAEICRKRDNDTHALSLLGAVYLDRGQLREAASCFTRLLRLDSEKGQPLEEVVDRLIKEGALDEAHKYIVPLCESFLQRQAYDEAVRLLRNILYVDENHQPTLRSLVEVYREAGDTENAVLNQEKLIDFYKVRGDQSKILHEIGILLDIDPNNREWQARYEAMGGGLDAPEPPSAVDYPMQDDVQPDMAGTDVAFDDIPSEQFNEIPGDQTDIHSFDNSDMMNQVDSSAAMSFDGAEAPPEARLLNHLTDAKMALRYDNLDQALEHLLKAKELDHLGVEVNTLLKDVYVKVGQSDQAVGCLVCLVNAYLDEGRRQEAALAIQEIAQYRPDIAEIHRNRLGEDHSDQGSLDQEEPEIMDFGNLGQDEPEDDGEDFALDMPNQPAEQEEDAFALDMPETPEEAEPPIHDDGDDSHFQLDFNAGDDTGEQRPDTFAVEDEPVFSPDSAFDITDEDISDLDMAAFAETSAESEPDLEQDLDPEPEAAPEPQAKPIQTEPEDAAAIPEPEIEEEAEDTSESSFEPPDLSILDEVDAAPIEDPGEPLEPEQEMAAPNTTDLDSLSGELEEIDFFISVEAFDDARSLIKEAITRFGEHPLLVERMHEVEDKTQAAGRRLTLDDMPTDDSPPAEDDLLQGGGLFDLAAELNEELFNEEESGVVNDNTKQEEVQTVEELFQEFKKGVDEQIDEGDFQTHYDLGIAYKEMGLLSEAIDEFEKAKGGADKFLECTSMIASCLNELGRPNEVVTLLETSLTAPQLTDQERLVLQYELGRAFEDIGETDKALTAFREVEKSDPAYRDLSDRIEALV